MTGVILAGGQSRRMGRNKALLEVGGRRIVDRVFDAIGPLVDRVMVVRAGDDWIDAIAAARGAAVVTDRYPGAGSLGGIYTGLDAARDTVFVVACDMPFINRQLVVDLMALATEADVAIPMVNGNYETLHAVYQPSCLAAIRPRLEAGRYKIIDFFADVRVRCMAEVEVRRRDPNLLSSFNVNTPEDLDRAQFIASELAAGGE